MHLAPGLYQLYEWMQQGERSPEVVWKMANVFGMNMEGCSAVGLFGVDYQGSRVAVLGCVGCLSGRAAGVLRHFRGLHE